MKRILSIDIETFSRTDLKKRGLYKYVEDVSFRILLFAFKYNVSHKSYQAGKVYLIDLASGEKIPQCILDDIEDPEVLKKAFNAQFERVCIGRHMDVTLDPTQWTCTMIKAASLGLPMGLGNVAKALHLHVEKDKEGAALIRYFCIPCKPTKKNGMRTRNLPKHDPTKWIHFGRYCIGDVVVEDAIDAKLASFPVPATEALLWQMDQRINDRGVLMSPDLISSAVELHEVYKDKLMIEAGELTGLDNPNSLAQLKKWLTDELDEDINSLNKDDLTTMIRDVDDEDVRRVLWIRQETSKSSIKKYATMLSALNRDEFIRGVLQFYGAKTGRWSGKIIQPHNLKKNSMKHLDAARQLVLSKDIDMIEIMFGSLSYVLSQLIRTSFIAGPGHRLIMSDLASIESRVLAWCAGEEWKLEVFRTHGKIYEAMGSRMFNMVMEEIVGDWRDKAKVGELACGYQGGEGAIARMWPKHLPLPVLETRQEIVGRFRVANKKIKQLWYDVQNAAIDTVDTGISHSAGRCTFYMQKGVLLCKLPSGRSLAYFRPSLVEGMYGPQLQYYGVNPKTFQWGPRPAYGGLLVENMVQAIARDVLGEKMLKMESLGHDICFHVHDEVIIDAPLQGLQQRVKQVNRIMSENIDWAPGLPLAAKTMDSPYYKKD